MGLSPSPGRRVVETEEAHCEQHLLRRRSRRRGGRRAGIFGPPLGPGAACTPPFSGHHARVRNTIWGVTVAGSFVVILLWIYYSAQVFFFGAEFTKVYSRRFGVIVVPDPAAVPLTAEARAAQGMDRGRRSLRTRRGGR